MIRDYSQRIANLLKIQPMQVTRTVALLDEGNTIPFIARYRKELTFNLDEFLIRQIEETVTRMRQVDERRDTITASIGEQGKLTEDLQGRIERAETLTELEDLYQPYKPKRRTRASTAREAGLEPLAQIMLAQPLRGEIPESAASRFISEQVPHAEAALQGARDIVAEAITDDPAVRGGVRDRALRFGTLTSVRTKDGQDEKGVFKTYYEFEMRVASLKPHQTLAINRGESEGALRVSITVAERDWRDTITTLYKPDKRSPWSEHLTAAIEDGASRLLLPAIERDVRRDLTERSDAHAIQVFAENLGNLLLQPPMQNRVIMGIDPAYRTGCKIAVIDAASKVLEISTIYPHAPQNKTREALAELLRLIERHHVTLIAIGNGTASRETEQLVAGLTRQFTNVQFAMVNEAGASVYSASDLARAEMPDLDVSLRGAVSIARRLQDPLAELVKIDPKSIGVGMYQHDVNQGELAHALDAVVESVVNQVGVDVNTASPALLQYVAGIGPRLAEAVVAHREENGPFASRAALKKVKGMGAKSFEQCAGFLRVRDGSNPLDASAIHPESYAVAKELLARAGTSLVENPTVIEAALTRLLESQGAEQVAEALGTGLHTLLDICDQLVRPGRDPRSEVAQPLLRSDVLTMEDLKPGMLLDGTVRNVVDFGAFIDIGVKQDGLLHISRIPRGIQLGVGDIVSIEILSVDHERGRIGLGWAAR